MFYSFTLQLGFSNSCSNLFLQARSDLAPNWYVAGEGLEPRTIANTAGEGLDFVFDTSSKRPWDLYSSVTAADLGHAALLVIPTPEKIVSINKTWFVSITKAWTACGTERLRNELDYLAGKYLHHLACRGKMSCKRVGIAMSSCSVLGHHLTPS